MNGLGLFRDGLQSGGAIRCSVVDRLLFEPIKGQYMSAVTGRINRSTYHEGVFAAAGATPRIGMEPTDVRGTIRRKAGGVGGKRVA